MCLALLGGGSGSGKLFFCRAGTMKCFYILFCPVTGKGFFLNDLSLQSHELHGERTGTWWQSTLNQIYLEIGKYSDFFFPFYLCEVKPVTWCQKCAVPGKHMGKKMTKRFYRFLMHYLSPVAVTLKWLHLLSVFILCFFFLFCFINAFNINNCFCRLIFSLLINLCLSRS